MLRLSIRFYVNGNQIYKDSLVAISLWIKSLFRRGENFMAQLCFWE